MAYRTNENGKQIRGFAAMPAEQRSKIARLGGMASHGGGRPASKKGGSDVEPVPTP